MPTREGGEATAEMSRTGVTEHGGPARLLRVLRDSWRNLSVEGRFTIGYLVLGLAWIHIEHRIIPGEDYQLKDSAFIVSSALFLYWIVRVGVARIRRSEQALQESDRKLARILETTASGILVVDRGGTITFSNRSAELLFGVPAARIVGRKYSDPQWKFLTPDGAPLPPDQRPVYRVLASNGAVHAAELGLRRADGVPLVLSVNAAPIRDAAGAVTDVVVSMEDITERKRAHDRTLRKLSLALEQSPIAVAVTDRAGRIEYVNPTFMRRGGAQAAGVAWTRELFSGGEDPEVVAQIRRAVAEGTGWTGTVRVARADGGEAWESVSLTPIRDEDDHVANFLWVSEDVTEHRLSDRLLRESEERFRQMFEQNEEPVILFRSGSAEILDANPAALALYGFAREELSAAAGPPFVEADERDAFARLVSGIRNGHGLNVERASHVRKDGQRITVSIRGKCMKLRGGTVSYLTFRDITERVRLEEEAKVRQAQLIHASRIASLGMLVSGVAHEVNNPNNLIMFNAPIVKGAWRDAAPILDRRLAEEGSDFLVGGLPFSEMRDAVPRLLDGIEEASRRIKAIVENLKEFAALDRSSADCVVDVNAFTRVAISILQPEIARHTSRFETAFAGRLPAVRGCSQQLEQVVLNLVMNALQAVPDPSRAVRVETGLNEASGWVEIRVSDEGVGIPAETIRRLGEPFFSTKGERGGLGLGLSISHSIVKAHGGRLVFESAVGRGTTVTIALPPAVEPAGQRASPEGAGRVCPS